LNEQLAKLLDDAAVFGRGAEDAAGLALTCCTGYLFVATLKGGMMLAGNALSLLQKLSSVMGSQFSSSMWT
jgi:hypothetical protein